MGPTYLAIVLKPLALLVFMSVLWWLNKALWHFLGPGPTRERLFAKDRPTSRILIGFLLLAITVLTTLHYLGLR